MAYQFRQILHVISAFNIILYINIINVKIKNKADDWFIISN